MCLQVNVVRSDKTALQIASHQGLTGVVELLVQLGADVNLQVSESFNNIGQHTYTYNNYF